MDQILFTPQNIIYLHYNIFLIQLIIVKCG